MASFSTEQAAIDHLQADGFHLTESGEFFAKRGMTQGSLTEAPYESVCLVEIIHNRVDPKWNAPDFYTLRFH